MMWSTAEHHRNFALFRGNAAIQTSDKPIRPQQRRSRRSTASRLAVLVLGQPSGFPITCSPRQPKSECPALQQRRGIAPAQRKQLQQHPDSSFLAKVRAAWNIFFPPKPEQVSPREAGKSRLRMILVADRCGLNQSSMHEMRHSIVRAVSDYVEIEAEDLVEVNISSEPEMGTVYSVAVPVKRVRPQARSTGFLEGEEEADGVTLMWDDDPEDRFPFGC